MNGSSARLSALWAKRKKPRKVAGVQMWPMPQQEQDKAQKKKSMAYAIRTQLGAFFQAESKQFQT